MRRQTLNTYLKERRMELGLTQKQVSDALGFSSSQMISNYERGLCMVPLASMRKLCKLLEIDREYLKRRLLLNYKDELERFL